MEEIAKSLLALASGNPMVLNTLLGVGVCVILIYVYEFVIKKKNSIQQIANARNESELMMYDVLNKQILSQKDQITALDERCIKLSERNEKMQEMTIVQNVQLSNSIKDIRHLKTQILELQDVIKDLEIEINQYKNKLAKYENPINNIEQIEKEVS